MDAIASRADRPQRTSAALAPTKLERAAALAGLLLLGIQGAPARAQVRTAAARAAPPATIWVYPVIRGYGGVHPRPDLAGPPPDVDYRVIADVVHGSRDPRRVAGSLVRLARLVNLMGYGKVPRGDVHIAAVIEGRAGFAALSNAAYRKRFHVDNPNLALLGELERAGVKLMVCSQALAENGLRDGDVAPGIEITLSALTDFALYGARGYSYMRL